MSGPRHDSAELASSATHTVLSQDLTGTIVIWSPAAEHIFGYAEAEALGQPATLIIPDECRPQELQVLDRVRRGEIVVYDSTRVDKQGQRLRVVVTAYPIREANGDVAGAAQMVRDLAVPEAVQHDAHRLAAIVDSSDDAIASKNLNGIVTSWNAAAESMFGFSAAEIVGRSIRLIIPEDRQEEEDEVLRRVRRGEKVDHYETIRRRKDGTLLPVSLTVSPILSEDGTVVGASKIARDITERKRAEEERQRLLLVAWEASRLKDEFLATLSHELRTPLNAIVGYLRLMEAGLVGEERQRDVIETLVRNAVSLGQLVEDVLDVSRIVSGKLKLKMRPVRVADAIRDAADTVRGAAEAKGIHLEIHLSDDGLQVLGDTDRLRQVVWNLCLNAVKFTEPGGRVTITLKSVDSNVTITVQDTGIGIAPTFVPHVFERFRQAESGMARTHGGLGLGLAICRHLVELHGGKISVESEGLGHGSTFRIECPLLRDAPDEFADSPAGVDVPAEIPMLESQLRGIRVLVIDDEPDALALAREVLEAAGAAVDTALSGQEALAHLQFETCDILLIDLAMPGMSGLDLLARIHTSDRRAIRDVPAIALTGFASHEDRMRALRHGFQFHLAKPLDPPRLVRTIATLARLAQTIVAHRS